MSAIEKARSSRLIPPDEHAAAIRNTRAKALSDAIVAIKKAYPESDRDEINEFERGMLAAYIAVRNLEERT